MLSSIFPVEELEECSESLTGTNSVKLQLQGISHI